TIGKSALANGKLNFSSNHLLWSSDLRTDDGGEYSAKVWDGGSWTMRVDVPGEKRPFYSFRALDNKAEHYWDVSIPTRAITGHVVDAKSGEPVVGADVYDLYTGERSGTMSVTADEEGKFRLAM